MSQAKRVTNDNRKKFVTQSTVFTTCWILFSQFKFRAILQENRHNRVLKWWHLKNILCWNYGIWCRILIENPKGPGKRGHIVADTLLTQSNVSPFACVRNICCGHKFCVRDTKNVSDFVQKHFVSTTNVSQFAQPKKHHGQQCAKGVQTEQP